MSEPSFTLITTTINLPVLLTSYVEDAKRYGRNLREIIVAGDKKTPADAPAFCSQLEKTHKIPCRYLGVEEQNTYMRRFPALDAYIPWNSVQRRDVALLSAYESGADIVVTIDDDNFICEADYFGAHAHVGKKIEVDAISAQGGWWNVCDMMIEAKGTRFYHRGYPLSKRWTAEEAFTAKSKIHARVAVSAGLWLDDPDVDAITRLTCAIRTLSIKPEYPARLATAIGTLSPFNSQNTALARDLIPAYFLCPQVGRYDDIWASYLIRRISDHLGDVVTYGAPLVRQKRNAHDYFRDFDVERFGLEFNDVFLEALALTNLTAKTYQGAFAEIANQFPARIAEACDRHRKTAEGFKGYAEGLILWRDAFETFKG